jgi:pyruvate dehydrogenase E1 component alpha subunit
MEQKLYKKMLETMLKIRVFEQRAVELFSAGELPGWIHSYIGEEAVATGVCLNLNDEDSITSTHRGHGHCIAKGADVKNMMAELYGKTTGCCRGKGGSMHIADYSKGIIGANGIVGGGIPIATGVGFANLFNDNKKVAVAFFGDGASNQGSFHESINLASVWKLPVIYVCENNLYGETCPYDQAANIRDIVVRAQAYNIKGIIIDGMDVIDVYKGINGIIDGVRNGQGPVLVEAKTYRYRGHWEGDPEVYRTKDDVDSWKKKDAIENLKRVLLKEKIMNQKEINEIEDQVKKEIEDAVDFGRKSPVPDEKEALDHVFV